ncbi:DeoR/GlpR family DNA-binding transcription regulator [Mycolicibacterium komossense]|uniref:DeoR/GlpR transcriptional regulator n=1 Tax=Mycolicibacterium komossense TaxID=1779 RepID=A0ABT3CHJ1_9MYCO|nr:DeoR/GlpR family DNA-binding transcription regulator [Mycolicibacterium komossense]MCV7228923.1 DeoR/GlpR transcriptional regulator [Mycolicibacterium komossense]
MAVRESQVRRAEIVRLAKTTGLAGVDDLSDQFGVTASTIRRDLAQLTAEGLLARTYGGAIAVQPHPESSLRQRAVEDYEVKRLIAKWAASQVKSGETILLDAGTTVGAMAEFLRELESLTVVTAGLTALAALADADQVRVECLGGTLRHLSQGFVGPLAEANLARLSFDRAFLGADSVTADRGICEAELGQTRLKELMMERAGDVYVLAHAAKLGERLFHAWAPLPSGVTLVTDSSVSAEQLAPFAQAGIHVVTV